jgi:GH15 family glucan-1,4-alpha-glucosidase
MDTRSASDSATTTDTDGYRPIEDYGLIGDMHTVALVSRDGSIDWCCLPRFDAPSVFARLLDGEQGGFFQVALRGENVTTKQFYWPETNVLVTRFLSADGVGEVRDFMPVAGRAADPDQRQIVRTVRAVRGTVTFHIECEPAFDYARADHDTDLNKQGVCFRSKDQVLSLAANIPLRVDGDGVVDDVTLSEGESTTLVLRDTAPATGCPASLDPEEAEQAFRATVQYWRDWLSQCTYTGRWREEVHRSALALKLLTYEPTGAIVAAPTCSLPEDVGGVRNWDYRYTWIRDAAFTLYAFLRIGFTDEARAFIDFLSGLCMQSAAGEGPLQIMYGIDGRTELTEETLDHLEGYRGSAPVRVGNGAYDQLQLDIYGAPRRPLPARQVRRAPVLRDVAVGAHLRRLGVRPLGPARRRGVGGARGAAALRLLEAHVLGGRGPRPAPRPQAVPARRRGPLAAVPQRHLRSHHGKRLERRPAGLYPAARGRNPRRLQSDDAAGALHLAG